MSNSNNQAGWRIDCPMELIRPNDLLPSNSSDSSESECSVGSVAKLAEAMTNAFKNFTSPGPSRMSGGDMIPAFDPNDVNQTIEDWVAKVDEVGDMFKWADDVKMFNALTKLRGLASVWYKGLKSIKLSWGEWKGKLCRAFPSQRDFNELLETMMARKKIYGETFAQYFYEKQALLNACKIQGKDAVSCIIAGIQERHIKAGAKAANCNDPEALFDYLRSLNDEITLPPPFSRNIAHTSHINRKRRLETAKSLCFLCKKPGHTQKDCKGKRPESRRVRCYTCQEEGHISINCPKKRKTETTK